MLAEHNKSVMFEEHALAEDVDALDACGLDDYHDLQGCLPLSTTAAMLVSDNA